MKKYLVLHALVSLVFFIHNTYCCPCNMSTTDKRPFFEQYESTQDAIEEDTAENTDDITEIEKQ